MNQVLRPVSFPSGPRYLPHSKVSRAALLLLLMLGICAHPSRSSAQVTSVKFESISLEQGLSQSTVRCILQDNAGFMWFGTEDGLNKYDGYSFKIYQPDPDDSQSISSNFNRALFEDRSGVLWVGTNGGGLNRFDRSSDTFSRYLHDPDDTSSISSNFVGAILEDRSGMLWVTTDGGGLERFDRNGNRFIHYRHDPADPSSISSDAVISIYEDRSGTLWLGTRDGGLNRFNRSRGIFTRYLHDPADPRSLSSNFVRAIHEDRYGVLWIGTDGGGLNRFDPVREQFDHFRHDPSDPSSLRNNRVWAIFEDRSGTLWIGTDGGGLNRYDPERENFIQYLYDPNDPGSLGNNSIFSIYEDRLGVLWFGTETNGVNKLDREKEKFFHIQAEPGNPNSLKGNHVWSICEDSDGILWIGTRTGGLNRFDERRKRFTNFTPEPDNPNGLPNTHLRVIYQAPSNTDFLWLGTDGGGLTRFDPERKIFTTYRHEPGNPSSLLGNRVYSILEDSRSRFWIGTRTGGLNRFDRDTGRFTHFINDPTDSSSLSNNFIYKIYEDRSGALWIGTFAGGLNRFDPDTGNFTAYRADTRDAGSLSSDCVLTIYQDGSGVLWIGTAGGGLNRFNPETETFSVYREKDGLPNEVVYGILEDAQGNLWLSTNAGLSRFNPETQSFKSYTRKDGLQSDEFNGGSYFRSRSGKLLFGGINGFNIFDPGTIHDNPHIPPVVITSFKKGHQEVDLERPISEIDVLTLSHKDYVFSFEFAALDFTAPDKNMYAYKMEGLDEDWIIVDASKRFANYTTLPPGKYRFRVKGSNNDGIWNEEGASVTVIITPPLWKTWWMQIIAVGLILGIILTLHKWRSRHIRSMTQLDAAHAAQMSIMPQSDPKLDGYDISGACIPAHEVGGDFYDYIWLDEEKTKFGIAVGDVSGKAMQAAMIAVMSNGMIYSKAHEAKSPQDIMTRLNRSMYSKTNDWMFTALCLGAIDISSKAFTFANAGFNVPLLKTNGSVAELENDVHMYPLGIIEEAVYQERTIQLHTDDVLVLFSDGIPEARNDTNSFYENETLVKLLKSMETAKLSAREIKDRIVEDVKRFTGSADQQDDITLVVVKLT